MRRYAIKRILTVAPVLAGMSIIVFGPIHRPPGDPAVPMLDERAIPECVKDVRVQHRPDRPLEGWDYPP